MSFYTFCDRVGGKIYHRYIDANGNRRQEVISETPLSLYVKTFKPDWTDESIFGDHLTEFTFTNVSDMNDFVKRNEDVMPVFGQTSVAHQFISNKYPGNLNFDMKKFRIMNFDIEVRHDGYDDDDLCTVRRVWSNDTRETTIGEMKTLGTQYEVYDKYNDMWYPCVDNPLFREGGFPEAEDADYEITTISLKLFGRSKRITLGLKDYKTSRPDQMYIRCENEAHLLREFLHLWVDLDVDIITGWNIEQFDVPYIVNRINKVLGDGEANRLSPFYGDCRRVLTPYMAGDDKDMPSYRILGVTTFDYMLLYMKFNPRRQESYALNYIAEVEVKATKFDYSKHKNMMEFYKDDFQGFVDYNEIDVDLVEQIDRKKNFIRLAITTVLMTKSRYQEVMGKVKLWDNLIYNMLRAEKKQIPPQPPRPKSLGKIIGAYVKDPIPGKYRYVVSLDLTSLYPSIAMMYRMSPETMVRREIGTLEIVDQILAGASAVDFDVPPGHCMAANGTVFRLDIDGVIPKAMKYVFDTRQYYKDQMKVTKNKKEDYIRSGGTDQNILDEYDILIASQDAAQQAMKVLANSGYGVTAQESFRYYSRDIAQGITVTGQLTIRYILNEVNAWLNKRFGVNKDWVITADTDSMYLALDMVPTSHNDPAKAIEELDIFVKNELQPFIDEAFVRLSERMGCPVNMMDMKREALSDIGIWRAKKNYVLRVWDMEGVRYAEPEMKMMGIETAKSSFPKVVRDEMEKCIKIMLEGTEADLIAELKDFRSKWNQLDLPDICKTLGVSNVPSSLTDVKSYNSRAAVVHNNLIRTKGLQREIPRIRSGNKVKIANLKKINPLRENYIAFIGQLPKEFEFEEYIDRDAMYDSVFLNPVKSFTNIIGWKTEKVSSLMGLFG